METDPGAPALGSQRRSPTWRNNDAPDELPEYRRQGLLPNHDGLEGVVGQGGLQTLRVKGKEMFWNEPAGARGVLQVEGRPALSDVKTTGTTPSKRVPGCPSFPAEPKVRIFLFRVRKKCRRGLTAPG